MEIPFSQRMGAAKPKSVIQIDSMDHDLRLALWNVVSKHIWYSEIEHYSSMQLRETIWCDFCKQRMRELPGRMADIARKVEDEYFMWEWYKVYDFIELVACTMPQGVPALNFVDACNKVLTRELSGYRFIGTHLIPNTSEIEIKAIEDAIGTSSSYTEHLDKALCFLSNKEAPDYENSIKEAISAVEATCKLITGNFGKELGPTLKELEARDVLHPSLKAAINTLYGYTCNAVGIRHGRPGKPDSNTEDAMFMLVSCSAIINYLVARASRGGIDLKIPPR